MLPEQSRVHPAVPDTEARMVCVARGHQRYARLLRQLRGGGRGGGVEHGGILLLSPLVRVVVRVRVGVRVWRMERGAVRVQRQGRVRRWREG